MKWWGWGDPNISFSIENRSYLWPWLKEILNLNHDKKIAVPVCFDQINIPPTTIDENFLTHLSTIFTPDQILSDDEERLLHTYGKSYANLFCVRKGNIKRAPDLIVLPESHEQIEKFMQLAHQHNICVIPFGGGTNIVGSIDPREPTQFNRAPRIIVSLDMKRMNRVLEIDPESQIAIIQPGILGPKLESDLQKKGCSLGHYPDSFEYSTLGGWLATRSAGMQSDAYGRIENMLISLKLVTPTGTITTKTVPASSSGPDLNKFILGSEGILGVITEATMRIHPIPAHKDYRGFLFYSFEDGVRAICECIANNCSPSMVRLQDETETQLAFNMKIPKKGMKNLIHKQIKKILQWKGYHTPCLLIVGFEGNEKQIKLTMSEVYAIFKKYAAFHLGTSVGDTWAKDKFNMPYLRDWIMDYGVMVDVAETSVTWSQLLPLYKKTMEAVKTHFKENANGYGYIGCHISHTYETGACLYFTYATKQILNKELEQYYSYKKLITDIFTQNGGTLSHHHAVGYEHAPWMEAEISKTGIRALNAIKKELDPLNICNPGKVLPIDAEQKLGFFGIDASDLVHNAQHNAQKSFRHETSKTYNEAVI